MASRRYPHSTRHIAHVLCKVLAFLTTPIYLATLAVRVVAAYPVEVAGGLVVLIVLAGALALGES